jgi:hypothetical protein
MARKRYKPEEIVAKLRQVDVLVSQGQNMVDAIRQIGLNCRCTRSRKVELFINLKTANRLGVTFPFALSGRGDKVIE